MNWWSFSFTYRWCLFSISLIVLSAVPQDNTISVSLYSNAYSIINKRLILIVIIIIIIKNYYNNVPSIIMTPQQLPRSEDTNEHVKFNSTWLNYLWKWCPIRYQILRLSSFIVPEDIILILVDQKFTIWMICLENNKNENKLWWTFSQFYQLPCQFSTLTKISDPSRRCLQS